MISHTVQIENSAWIFFCAFNIGPAAAVPAVPVPPPLHGHGCGWAVLVRARFFPQCMVDFFSN